MSKPNPGSSEAVEAGCKCPVIDNHYGEGWHFSGSGQPMFILNRECPIHGTVAQLAAKKEL